MEVDSRKRHFKNARYDTIRHAMSQPAVFQSVLQKYFPQWRLQCQRTPLETAVTWVFLTMTDLVCLSPSCTCHTLSNMDTPSTGQNDRKEAEGGSPMLMLYVLDRVCLKNSKDTLCMCVCVNETSHSRSTVEFYFSFPFMLLIPTLIYFQFSSDFRNQVLRR